jgi:hypothetical protein
MIRVNRDFWHRFNLNDSPVRLKFGVTYTPFPLTLLVHHRYSFVVNALRVTRTIGLGREGDQCRCVVSLTSRGLLAICILESRSRDLVDHPRFHGARSRSDICGSGVLLMIRRFLGVSSSYQEQGVRLGRNIVRLG